ncbi:MAG: Rrf2 family transcriptional regulator, partial [Calditrichaeota bacterium]|nr:Rrf2 family transcriptional regulator [Calditrichota bacterium]
MLKFSKKVEYALISMLYMAKREDGELTTSRELSQHFNIPQELAGKVLQSLARTGCIASVQGVKGG